MQGINENHVSVAFKKSCHALVVVHKMRPIAIVAYVCVRLSSENGVDSISKTAIY